MKRFLKNQLRRIFVSTLFPEIRSVVGDPRCSPAVRVLQLQLFQHYRSLVLEKKPLPSIFDVGYGVFSQFDEGGILLFVFAVLGMKTRRCIDIGSGDGLNDSNCANLVIHFGWHGLFVDADEIKIRGGREFYSKNRETWAYPPVFLCARVTRENINRIICEANFDGEVDLLSVDIDGNDYWVWDAVDCVSPRVVVIETNVVFGYRNVVAPYDPEWVYPGLRPNYYGASPTAMVNLAHRKGYRLVGANRLGFNLFFVRNDEGADLLPEISIEQALWHPRSVEQMKLFQEIEDWPYIEG